MYKLIHIIALSGLLIMPTMGLTMTTKLLEEMNWQQAEQAIKNADVIIVFIGAASKEHGLHLPNNTDFIQANYLRDKLLENFNAVAAPTVSYNYYPAFIEYPGSMSLNIVSATGIFIDICHYLHQQGAKKIYFLNVGISTLRPLAAAKEQLESENINIAYTDFSHVDEQPAIKKLVKQERGTHADEIETSVMLYIAPEKVNMDLAQKDDRPDLGGHGRLTPIPNTGQGVYSPTGAWGDPTLATKEKGEIIIKAMLDYLQEDIKKFTHSSAEHKWALFHHKM